MDDSADLTELLWGLNEEEMKNTVSRTSLVVWESDLVGNLLADAGDTGSIPSPGRFLMLQGN